MHRFLCAVHMSTQVHLAHERSRQREAGSHMDSLSLTQDPCSHYNVEDAWAWVQRQVWELGFLVVSVACPIADNIFNKSDLGKKGVNLVYSSRGYSPPWWGDGRSRGSWSHCVQTWEAEGDECWCQFAFSFYSLLDLSPRDDVTYI